jgi:hypothetical protein
MSIATIMIINIAAAGILSAILAAVMLAPARRLDASGERAVLRRTRVRSRPLASRVPAETAS